MHVVAIGKGTVGTRYIAERDANQEREGQGRRPLFSNDRDGLTPARANQVLSDGNGKPNKADLRHIVLSPESARAYESLGDTDEERRDNFRDAARETVARFAEALGVKELRWVAGIHLNTDHPHVHILFHKDAIDAETGRPTRIKHIPKEWLMHNEDVPAARPAAAVERGDEEAGAASAGEAGSAAAAPAEQPAAIYAYRGVGGQQDAFQQFRGAYLSLEKQDAGRGVARPERRVAVALEPKDIYDPRGVIDGTDQGRSEADERRMMERLTDVPMHSFAATQTAVLTEFGYKAAADWEDGARDAKEPRRELIVFDASLVREAEEAPEAAPGQEAGAEGREDPQTATRVNYGRLGEFFGEEIEGRAFPVRQIAFHIDHSEDYTRRELLDARQRKPTEVEKLVGRWVMMEARLNGHEDVGSRILRLRLRDEVSRLDAVALERSQPRPAAYIPMNKLQNAIADNRLAVLRADGSLSPRYHTAGPSWMDEQRARIFDLQPSHGGRIYGVITADTNRIVAREVVTVEPPFRMPLPAPPEEREGRENAGPDAGEAYRPQTLKAGKGGWVHVTPDSPCPVCRKPDNCAVSTDSKRAYCRRVESDREGRDGGWFHDLTKLEGYTPRGEKLEGPAVVQYAKRPIEDRDRVNRKIMASLTLEERDRANLLSRGLSPEEIERDGYVSVPVRAQANEIAARLAAEGEDLRGVPGFWRPEGEGGKEGPWQLNLNYWYRGVMVPVRDPQGRVEGFQIRRAEVGEDEPRYVWLSSKSSKDSPKPEGTPSGAPVHFTNVENIRESGVAILTEGSLKANVISAYTDRGAVAIAGVSVFQDDFGRRLREELPELRRVWVAYDADAAEKKEVQKALERMSTVLSDAGLEVGVMRWPLEEGKGLDDYLRAKLGADFNTVRTEERAERQTRALAAAGLTDGAITPERRAGPAQTLQAGMVVEATGHVITEEEVTVSDWLHREAQASGRGMSGALRELRRDVAGIDEAAGGEGRPEVAAVMHAEDLAAGLESERLHTHEQLIAHQRTLDRIALGREFAARLELVHAGEKYNRCLEQAETRRYRVLDASTGFNREISARDIEQRAQARAYRTADERAAEVEEAAPKERAALRDEIKRGVIEGDRDEHRRTIEEIGKKHAEQLSGLDRTLQKACRTHDGVAPDARAVERAYRARGEGLPSPFIPEQKLDQLHEQALERRDVDTIARIEEIRIEIAREHGVPTRDDERAARLGGQHNVARSDLRVAERRAREFKESSHNRKWEIEGESKKWSLAEVDKEQSRRERELEYLGETGKFLGTRGLALQMFKQQVLGRVNPLNALRPSSLSPLYPIMHSPPVKAVRIGMQVYRWYQRRQEAQELAKAAADSIEHMKGLRPQIEERIAARQAELESEVSTQARLSETLGQMRETETAARAARGLEPAQAKYSEWEFRRLETNAMELRDGDMLREYERAASERVGGEVEKLAADLASGKTPEEAARELVENRIKEAMRELEPTAKQIHRLAEQGAEVPPNRVLASEKIEELTGEEAVWKKAGREAAEKLAASGQPLTPESLLEAHRAAFGSRAVARETVAEARALDAAARLAQFSEFREVTQVRYTTPEGVEQSGTLRETRPKNWVDSLRRWLSEGPADVAKREAIERAVAVEEARLAGAYDEARSFHEAASDIAEQYRALLSPGEELQPLFTSKEASELERFGGGLRPDDLARIEQLAELTEQQSTQAQYSRIVHDALADGRVANDPGAQTSQRTSLEKEADPVEREARQVAENPELGESAGAEVGGAEAAATAETEAELEEGLTLLL